MEQYMRDEGINLPLFYRTRVRCVNGEYRTLCRIGYEGQKYGFYFWFVGWDCFSLGISLCVSKPNLELHLPFGFIRIGKL